MGRGRGRGVDNLTGGKVKSLRLCLSLSLSVCLSVSLSLSAASTNVPKKQNRATEPYGPSQAQNTRTAWCRAAATQ